jgi:hypothetical protein
MIACMRILSPARLRCHTAFMVAGVQAIPQAAISPARSQPSELSFRSNRTVFSRAARFAGDACVCRTNFMGWLGRHALLRSRQEGRIHERRQPSSHQSQEMIEAHFVHAGGARCRRRVFIACSVRACGIPLYANR